MAYKTIVTICRDIDIDAAHLDASIAMAAAQGAHLHVLALGVDRTQPGVYFAGASAITVDTAMRDAMDDARATEKAVRERLKKSDVAWDVSGAYAQIGAVSQIVSRHATLADLVILPKPYGPARAPEDVAIIEAALFSTQTPVLVLPEGMDTNPETNRIVVAWNQSNESLAAIRAGLSILCNAQAVNIAIIDPPAHDPDRSDPGGLLAEMLSRHDIRCDISVLSRTMPRISDVLMRHVSDRNADMLVMGAYGHSRFREAILGGATRNMLEMANVPVLMAH